MKMKKLKDKLAQYGAIIDVGMLDDVNISDKLLNSEDTKKAAFGWNKPNQTKRITAIRIFLPRPPVKVAKGDPKGLRKTTGKIGEKACA